MPNNKHFKDFDVEVGGFGSPEFYMYKGNRPLPEQLQDELLSANKTVEKILASIGEKNECIIWFPSCQHKRKRYFDDWKFYFTNYFSTEDFKFEYSSIDNEHYISMKSCK